MFEKSMYHARRRYAYEKWEWALFFQIGEGEASDNDSWCIYVFDKKPTEKQIKQAMFAFERGAEIAIRYCRKPDVRFPTELKAEIIDGP